MMSNLKIEDHYLDTLESETNQAQEIGITLERLSGAFTAIEHYGITTTSMSILRAAGLTAGTSLDAIALESLTGNDNQINEDALEALSDSFKEKAAQYSAKILSVVSTGASKFWSVIETVAGKIKDTVAKLGDKAWDEVKAGGNYVKAHPVKTIVGILGAMAAVATLMIYSASNLPGAGQSREIYKAFSTKINGMIGKIPWPFGKVTSVVDDASRFKIDVVFPPRNAANIPVAEMGWNYKAAMAIGQHVDKTVAAVKHGLGVFGTKLGNGVKAAGHSAFGKIAEFRRVAPQKVYQMTGSAEAATATSFALGGIFFSTILSLCWAMWRLVKKIVIGGLRLIYSTLTSLF